MTTAERMHEHLDTWVGSVFEAARLMSMRRRRRRRKKGQW
jgi:hypothetical protein